MAENEKVIVLTAKAKEQGTKQVKTSFLALRRAMLSLMFTGYAVQRAMFGLLRSAMDMVGIFDMLNVTLGIVFLPIALALMEALMPILLWFMNLPDPVKMVIGGLALLAGVLGIIVAFLGALGAAFTGLTVLMAGMAPAVTMLTSVFYLLMQGVFALLAIPGAVFAVLLIAIIGFVSAWKENFANIHEWVQVLWEGLKNIFTGIKDVIMGIVNIIVGLFTGKTDKVIEGAKLLWEGVKKIFGGFMQFAIGFVVTLGISLFKGFLNLLGVLVDLLGKGFGWLWENLLKPAIEFGKNLVLSIVEGIKSMGKWIYDTILSFVPESLRDKMTGLFGGFGGVNAPKASTTSSAPSSSGMSGLGLESLQNNLTIKVVAPSDYSVNVRNGVGG